MKTFWDAQYGDINYLIVDNEIVFSLYADQAESVTFSAIMASVKALGATFRQVQINDLFYKRLGLEPENESDELAKWLHAEGAKALFAPFETKEFVESSTKDQESISGECIPVADEDKPIDPTVSHDLGARQVSQVGCITTNYDGTPLQNPRWYKVILGSDRINIEFYADGHNPDAVGEQEMIQDLWIEMPSVGDSTPTYRMTDNTKVFDETIQIYPK